MAKSFKEEFEGGYILVPPKSCSSMKESTGLDNSSSKSWERVHLRKTHMVTDTGSEREMIGKLGFRQDCPTLMCLGPHIPWATLVCTMGHRNAHACIPMCCPLLQHVPMHPYYPPLLYWMLRCPLALYCMQNRSLFHCTPRHVPAAPCIPPLYHVLKCPPTDRVPRHLDSPLAPTALLHWGTLGYGLPQHWRLHCAELFCPPTFKHVL